CRRLHSAIFPLLMRRAVRFRMPPHSMTVLMWSSKYGHTRVVKGLLDSGADINILDQRAFSALMYACESGHEEVVECLFANGAALHLTPQGESAFTLAATFDHPGVMRIFFRLGASVERLEWWTILLASDWGHFEV